MAWVMRSYLWYLQMNDSEANIMRIIKMIIDYKRKYLIKLSQYTFVDLHTRP